LELADGGAEDDEIGGGFCVGGEVEALGGGGEVGGAMVDGALGFGDVEGRGVGAANAGDGCGEAVLFEGEAKRGA